MTILARFSVGRILLHLLAMSGDRCVRFHLEGIVRELPSISDITRGFARARREGREMSLDDAVRYALSDADRG